MDITRNNNTKLLLQTQLMFPHNMEKNSDGEPRISTNPFAEDTLLPINIINLNQTKSLPSSSNQSSNSNSNSGSSNNSEIVNERRQSFSSQKSIGGEGIRSSGGQQRRVMLMESPCTPGRGVFSFSSNVSGKRRNFPSKWVDAEKWVTSCHESPANSLKNNSLFDGFKQQVEVVYTEKKVSLSPQDLVLKDKLENEVQQILPITEGFIFRDSDKFLNYKEEEEDKEEEEEAQEVKHRDMGTEMTPIGSVTASRCQTPFKTLSPARHNTPSKMSGPLITETKNVIDISEFADKLRLSGLEASQYYFNSVTTTTTSHWNTKEEEEEEISKSLRHVDVESDLRRSVSDSKAKLWDDEEDQIKFCQRYQREEAKIKAWVNLQNAKAEAQSRKLEVKIQKMRSNLEEKIMKRMDTVHRRAEDWRATARQQHAEQMQKAVETARKLTNRRGYLVFSRSSCGCLPCNN